MVPVADQQRRRAGSKEKRVTISALPPTPMFPPTHPNYSQAKGGLDLTTVRKLMLT